MRELLIGCGTRRNKDIGDTQFQNVTTLDIVSTHKPDIVADLNEGIPLKDNLFDEVHAYEVLEHLGSQGDAEAFFFHFSEIWRVLKPGGKLFATVPAPASPWVWADPSHRRAIPPDSLVFLSQAEYEAQIGKTAMTDFRYMYSADLITRFAQIKGNSFAFVLEAVK